MLDEIGINGFVMEQDERFLKLGTDAVLLSEFARVKQRERVCDLGCGTGAISLLLAARHKEIKIDGVEISEGAALLAKKNAVHNNIEDRFSVHNMDLKNVADKFAAASFDSVVSNPPFMARSAGLKTEKGELVSARMEIFCNICDVCKAASYLLKFGGLFSVVYRPERMAELISALRKNNLEPKRVRLIQDTTSAAPSLFLLEARKGGGIGISFMPTLIVKNPDGTETDEIRRIYRRK